MDLLPISTSINVKMLKHFILGCMGFALVLADNSYYERPHSTICLGVNTIFDSCTANAEHNAKLMQQVRKLTAISDNQLKLHQEMEKTIHKQYEEMKTIIESTLPEDCSSAKMRGYYSSNILIKPPGLQPRKVRCDQITLDGGWTVIVSRSPAITPITSNVMINVDHRPSLKDNSLSLKQEIPQPMEKFNRTWNDYKIGFGDPEKEYWIGNEVLHALTADRTWQALVILEDWSGQKAQALWNKFRVLGEDQQYMLKISEYQEKEGSAGDGLAYHNNRAFSTFDRDNDHHNTEHCAQNYGGGWWFHQCHLSLLTGASLGPGGKGHHAVHWRPWKGEDALKSAILMIRPLKM